MPTDKTFRSYRLSPECISLLDQLGAELDLDKTGCIEAGIRLLARTLATAKTKDAEASVKAARAARAQKTREKPNPTP
jgi:hypothetical protein